MKKSEQVVPRKDRQFYVIDMRCQCSPDTFRVAHYRLPTQAVSGAICRQCRRSIGHRNWKVVATIRATSPAEAVSLSADIAVAQFDSTC